MRKGVDLVRKNIIFILTGVLILLSIITGKVLLILSAIFFSALSVFALLISNENKAIEKKYSKIESNIQKVKGFVESDTYKALDHIIQIDEHHEQLLIADINQAYVYNFSDIIESEIIQDEVSISRTSRSNQVGTTLAGMVLAGGVGAVVGGLSSQKVISTNIKKLSLKIVVNDFKNPSFTIVFLNSDTPLNSDSQLLNDKLTNLTHWHSIIDIILNRNSRQIT